MIIRSVTFYILLSIWTFLLGLIFLPFLILPSKYIRIPALIWIKGIFIFLKYICRITHEIRGIKNIPDEPTIIVSKHQSAFETFAFYYYFKNIFFVHKHQLYFIPIFGQYLMKSKMVSINRLGGAKTMRKMLKDIKIRLDTGSSIIIFPEGTRKKPGDIPDYKTGFVGIYKENRRKLLPIALNSGLFWPKNNFIMQKGHIVIEIQKCIDIDLSREDVLKKVQQSIEEATNKLSI